MKRLYIFILLIVLGIQGYAQTQQGYVKTRGRLSSSGQLIPGVRLQGASIRVRNAGSYVSASNGIFAFAVPSNVYYIQGVSKIGYVLTDPDILSKKQQYSSNDLILVMNKPDEQLEDQLETESRIRTALNDQLQKKEQELKRLKEQNAITVEKYLELRKELMASHHDNEKLINEMVETFSKIDYDQVDEISRKISEYIINGELIKADSLLRLKGNIEERIDRVIQHKKANKEERQYLSRREEKLAESESYTRKEIEDIAQDCFFYYTRSRMLQQIDSAAYYLEQRAMLDTLNFDYVWRCGSFFLHERKYDRAKYYLEMLVNNDSLSPVDMGMALNDLSICYSYMGLTELGLTTMCKSLQLRKELAKDEPEKYNVSVALASCNYAAQNAIYSIGNKEIAYKCFWEGMDLYKKLLSYSHFFSVSLANAEENYAQLLAGDSRFTEAEEYLLKAYNTRCEYARRYPQFYNINKDISLREIEGLIGTVECDSFVTTRECKMILISEAEGNKERIASLAKVLADFYFYQKGDIGQCQYFLKESNMHVEELFRTDPNKYLPDITGIYSANANFLFNCLGDTINSKIIAQDLINILTVNETFQTDFSKELALSDMYTLLGRIQIASKNYLPAIDYLTASEQNICNVHDSILLNNRLAEIYKNMALAYLGNSDITAAKEYCQKRIDVLYAINDMSNEIISSICVAHYDMGLLALNSNDVKCAQTNFECAITKMEGNCEMFSASDFIQIYYYYGGTLMYDGQLKEALAYFKKILVYYNKVEDKNSFENIVNDVKQSITNIEQNIQE